MREWEWGFKDVLSARFRVAHGALEPRAFMERQLPVRLSFFCYGIVILVN